jgi:hypothetical protein
MRKYMVPLSIAITAIILVVTVVVGLSAFGTPKEIEQTQPLLSYNLNGTFTHQAYGYQVAGGETGNLVYFNKIIGSITGSYTYEFLSEGTVSDVKTSIRIDSAITSPSWSKAVELLPAQELAGGTVNFSLDTKGYLDLADTISAELGLGKASSINIVLNASLQTTATVNGKPVTEDFTQTCEMTVSAITIQIKRPLDRSSKGYQSGIVYQQRGSFGYSVALLPNILFGQATLTSPVPPVRILRTLDQAAAYQSDTIDNMNINFVYNLAGDQTITGVMNEVEASAVLTSVEGARATFPLIAKERHDSDFTLKIPIDIALMYDIIKKMENTDTYEFLNAYNLAVKVDVHTTASEPGVIDDRISAIIPIEITSSGVTVDAPTGTTKSGSLTETVVVENTARSNQMLIAMSLLFLTVLAALWAGYSFWDSRRERSAVHEMWQSDSSVMDKHKDILVDVREMPMSEGDRVTRVDSLNELVKLADSLLKPVLHMDDDGRHTFSVIDGNTRYAYFVIEPPKK